MERLLECGREFYGAMKNRGIERVFDRGHLTRMISDEDQEYDAAGDLTERVDALLDGAFYCADALARGGQNDTDEFYVRFFIEDRLKRVRNLGVDPAPLIELIHAANMTKFTLPGGRVEGGKWIKPPGFVPPDDAIRDEIDRQRNH